MNALRFYELMFTNHPLPLLLCSLLLGVWALSAQAEGYYIDPVSWQIRAYDHNATAPLALLTIDDSPHPASTEGFLALLERYDLQAIFFINGYRIDSRQTEVLQRVAKAGHLIGNHTWSHPNLTRLDANATTEEIVRLNRWVETHTHQRPRYFRPPYGLATPFSQAAIEKEQMVNMGWSVNSYDYTYRDRNDTEAAAAIAARTLRAMRDGGIILIHDHPQSLKALEGIIEGLLKRGYRFVLPQAADPSVRALDSQPHTPDADRF